MNIAIIGGGPIGCYAGYLLAKTGHTVTIYENHPTIGSPIQCTGILTQEFDRFNLPLDKFLVNTITKIKVYSPNKQITVKQKDYIVCRTKFDQYFAGLAEQAGATILVNHSFQRKEDKTLVIYDSMHKQVKRITPDIVIAADGPLSPTVRAYGFFHPQRENYFGVQATVEGNFDPTTIKTYFGNMVCPGLFAWITPESKTTARVGLAMKQNSREYFQKFMQQYGFVVKEMQAGTIPVFHPQQKLHQDNCYVVGDASSYVKATTLGGIVPAMQQVEILVDCLNQKKNYEKEIKIIRWQMQLHLLAQKTFTKFSDKEWDRLLGYVAQPKVQKIFEKYTRDNPVPLALHTLLREPRFLYFLKYLLPTNRGFRRKKK